MKRIKLYLIILLFLSGLGCQLTSPTPASWSGTPSAQVQAQRETAAAQTAQAFFSEEPTETPLPELPTENNATSTPSPTAPVDGPWLVFPDPKGEALLAYDVEARVILEINLPQPIYYEDLLAGRSPQGDKLFIRAGSPENLDELALYQINLPEAEATSISPLLSLVLQRQIVNQESPRALETLEAVTREASLSWSPNGRYLAFSAALDNRSSDLYLYDTWVGRTERLNGLYTHNGSAFWSPESNWLVSQEFERLASGEGWDSVNVTAIRVPGYEDQNTLYIPPAESQFEKIFGWMNAQSYLSASQTSEGFKGLREVNVENVKSNLILEVVFRKGAFDPETKFLGLIIDQASGANDGHSAGVYGLLPDSQNLHLIRAGEFSTLSWEPGGMFLAGGLNGLFAFPPEGQGLFLADEVQASLSPNGNWLIACGEGARLYQPPVGVPLQTLLEAEVNSVLWQPDSLGFFIQSEGTLFHFMFPGLYPSEVTSGFSKDRAEIMVWVE
ncbi:MAG: hypothetical protein ACOCYU_04125 [Brevefilum sp.]